MMFQNEPTDWKNLQDRVCQVLSEAGFNANSPYKIETVRGETEVDVHAIDTSGTPNLVYLCECKHWQTNVSQGVLRTFRTVMADSGAHVGFVISKAGFQPGCYDVITNTNIQLVTWTELQELFEQRWYENHFVPTLRSAVGPLFDYTMPLNSSRDRFFRENGYAFDRFYRDLILRYDAQAVWAYALCMRNNMMRAMTPKPVLPLRTWWRGMAVTNSLLTFSPSVLDARGWSDLLTALIAFCKGATEEFDVIVGTPYRDEYPVPHGLLWVDLNKESL